MQPVLTVEDMAAVDAAAQRHVPIDALIERAGRAVARHALRMLGGAYGHRVVVLAGKGHNGDDGRVGASVLARAGVRVTLLDAHAGVDALPPCDLVIDAAYGTGFRGEFRPPRPPEGALVLAVDIPSGVTGDTGEVPGGALRADATVTFGALKPGLLLGTGRQLAGHVHVEGIGLDVAGATMHLVEDADLDGLPPRPAEAHKWQTALYVAAGSPGMMGAAQLCSRAAMRAGAGMVRAGVPGATARDLPVSEAVAEGLPAAGWDAPVLESLQRCRALATGPGLGRTGETQTAVRALLASAPTPVVADADALYALGEKADAVPVLAARPVPAVLTPHAGEFARLAGAPGAGGAAGAGESDLVQSVRSLAAALHSVVLRKGSTTVIAGPDGQVLFVTSGSARLATAGTGDVLTGVIGALLARGVEPLLAAGLAAHAHGRAAQAGPPSGLVAGDLIELIPRALESRP